MMSCYNASRHVSEAIESILSQTYGDYELVVVNDGSTDDTLEIVQAYAQRDRRIRILDKANTGLADSLNAGMRMARGEWIARLDADDIALPDRLTAQMAYVQSHPGTVLLGSGFIEIDVSGESLRTCRYPAEPETYMRQIEKAGRFAPHSSCLYHKPTVERLGGFNPRFHRSQDADLWFRLSLIGEIVALPAPLVKIRRHQDSLSGADCGRTQAIFGMAAQVCHRLRLAGAADPSVQADADWQQFLEWLTRRVEQSGHLEQRHEWAGLRQMFLSTPSKAVGVCRLLKGLATSRCGLQIVHKKCFGSSLPVQLADGWICHCVNRQEKGLRQ